ncbi:bifunctional UDP-sugar hydrolase/5'-nucleotidase [Evansella sp. AB-rgal1]|uniref:bifunctional metallophosphatase/5'-nucleotidase n=1 Tax=Evansella sp. AB-rgal1 TaxID=3242696 RepID=UPI00359EF5C5
MKRMSSKFTILFMMFAVLFTPVLQGFTNESVSAKAQDNRNVSQEEFIKSLVEMLDVDMESEADLIDHLRVAQNINIVSRDEVETFAPNEKITREQAYVFLIRALNLANSYGTSILEQYRDYRTVSNSAKEYLAAASYLGFVGEEIVLRPNAPLKQQDLAYILSHYETNIDKIAIVHTNDLHGRVLYNPEIREMGFGKIAQIVENTRDSYENTFVFDMGDTFHGTNYVNFNRGMTAIAAMNAIGYDAMVPGNHDFNYGQDRLLEISDALEFPIVSANVLKEEGEYLPPYEILERNGKSFALIGMVATDTPEKTHPDGVRGLSFEDEVEYTQMYVDQLKDEVDHIIVLSHSGFYTDERIAEQVDGVDLILGGHSHTTIETPRKIGGTYVTQAYEHGKAVGFTTMLFYNDELIGINGHLKRDSDQLQEQPDIAGLLETYKAEVEEALEEVIGTVDVYLDGAREHVRIQETNLGNMVSDAQRDYLDTDIAFTNGGNIRASLNPGEVKVADIYTVLPFDNTLVKLELTGDQILRSLEHSVRLYPSQNGGFLHVSGMTFSFQPANPAGERVVEVIVGGEPLELERTYTVATNDFLAAGGDGYTMFGEGRLVANTGELLSTVMINYIADQKPIPGLEGRIVNLGQ